MEVLVWFIAEQALSLALGFGGGMAYHRHRLWRIKRHAPSAKATGFQVGLSQEDFDGLPKKEEDVVYMIAPGPQSGSERPSA